MDKLKPCPFCGGKAKTLQVLYDGDTSANVWAVGCDGINGSLCPGYIWKCSPIYYGEELAIKMWNKRNDAI